jgi:hypothetical protein
LYFHNFLNFISYLNTSLLKNILSTTITFKNRFTGKKQKLTLLPINYSSTLTFKVTSMKGMF